jgi:hypothetical protein
MNLLFLRALCALCGEIFPPHSFYDSGNVIGDFSGIRGNAFKAASSKINKGSAGKKWKNYSRD